MLSVLTWAQRPSIIVLGNGTIGSIWIKSRVSMGRDRRYDTGTHSGQIEVERLCLMWAVAALHVDCLRNGPMESVVYMGSRRTALLHNFSS